MTRDIGAPNIPAVEAAHVVPVYLVSLAFSTPVYVHSGIGTINWNGNDYLGVGDLGAITGGEESEDIVPAQVVLQLSGVQPGYVTEALNAGNYGDIVTIYKGYKDPAGALVGDPWQRWRGSVEHSGIRLGAAANVVEIVCQHELARLSEKNGARWSNEDQRTRFPNDTAFSFMHTIAGQSVLWGGRDQTLAGTDPGGIRPESTDREIP